MATTEEPTSVRLNSSQLRVLAHPLRSRLLFALRVYGPATSTGLAQRLDTNTGATSYHLRKLADVGLVEEDNDRGVHRERWWQTSHNLTTWVETEFSDDPDDRSAADWLLGHQALIKSRWLGDWLASRHDWSPEWRNAADNSDYELRLNAEQLSALRDDLHGVINRYLTNDLEPEGDTERVVVLLDAFPSPEPRL